MLVHLNTQDVLHSFFLPHVRVKQDALPGKTIPVWFTPTKEHGTTPTEPGRWKRPAGLDGMGRNRWEEANAATSPRRSGTWPARRAVRLGPLDDAGQLYVHETRKTSWTGWHGRRHSRTAAK